MQSYRGAMTSPDRDPAVDDRNRAADSITSAAQDEGRVLDAWHSEVTRLAHERLGPEDGTTFVSRWRDGLQRVYTAAVPTELVVDDLLRAEDVLAQPERAVPVVEVLRGAPDEWLSAHHDSPYTWRLRLYRPGPAMLSRILPLIVDLGVEVSDERPYLLRRHDGASVWLYDLGLGMPAPSGGDDRSATDLERFRDAFAAAWADHVESDALSRLVLGAGLTWQQVDVLRALVGYLRQTGLPHSLEYVARTLADHPESTRMLVRLFEARTLPERLGGPRERESATTTARREVEAMVESIAGRDADRIMRSLWSVVEAILRTNAYRRQPPGGPRSPLSFKIASDKVPGLPEPRPRFEIWVHSPRMEGVHLRFGSVARGGLRWSNRLEDFRTEVLGLVKAQVVKNAVIVPTGAKGGFVAKRLPDVDTNREAWWAEGVACYRSFISGILDVTDNLVLEGEHQVVVAPEDVVRHDADDPYLVVAADKGTSTFSDIANELAVERGFWLGDAFASGGSNGYDHKAMGITARGAWESVRRHFRELATDPQTTNIAVVGIGDMSGDVFGNGMLLSRHICLVAAFDHRHIFLDPDPDPAASYVERQRLFAMPRSSWADYDATLFSAGGGVHPRTAKSIPVAAEVVRRLGLPEHVTALPPDDLIRAILAAPVDLLWNGGIGTYVKASSEQHLEVGDKANDAVRVDASDLRVRVVGEGGNLGLTQRARVQAAMHGVLLNNDAVDNSAGVDCSDHEVNIKIALDQAVVDGALTEQDRSETLIRMTDDVARLVLSNNRSQNETLSDEGTLAPSQLPAHRRMIDALVVSGQIDRELEVLPTNAELDRRARDGAGLTVPELSVLLAHAKIWLATSILASSVPDEDWVTPLFRGYFPDELGEQLNAQLDEHPLRRDIATTVLVNSVIDRGGITMVHRAVEESGRSAADVVRAAAIVSEVFDLPALAADVRQLDGRVPAHVQTAMRQEQRRLIDRAIRWLLQSRTEIDVVGEVRRFRSAVERLAPEVPDLLLGQDKEYVGALAASYSVPGAPPAVALRTARVLYVYALLHIVELADSIDRSVDEVAEIWFKLSQRFRFDVMLTRISALSRDDTWQVHARSALRFDLYDVHSQFTASVLAAMPETQPATRDIDAMIDAWEQQHPVAVARAINTLDDVDATSHVDLAVLAVALRNLRQVIDRA
jgi:glutamate dehydrogenase